MIADNYLPLYNGRNQGGQVMPLLPEVFNPDSNAVVGTIGGIAGTAFAWALWMRRQMSKNKVEITRDRAEVHIIQTLIHERDTALQHAEESRKREEAAWAAKAESARLIGEMSAQLEQQTKVIKLLEGRIESLRKDVHWLRNQLYGEKLKADLDAAGVPPAQGSDDV
jgi:hypothetical protein